MHAPIHTVTNTYTAKIPQEIETITDFYTVLEPWSDHSSAWYFQQKSPDTSHTWRKLRNTTWLCWNNWFFMSCNSGSAKTLFQSHSVEQHKRPWLNHDNRFHYARHLLWGLANNMHKNVHRRALGRLRVMGLEREESRRVALSSGLCLEC